MALPKKYNQSVEKGLLYYISAFVRGTDKIKFKAIKCEANDLCENLPLDGVQNASLKPHTKVTSLPRIRLPPCGGGGWVGGGGDLVVSGGGGVVAG